MAGRDGDAVGDAGESSAGDSSASASDADEDSPTDRERAKRLREEARERWGRTDDDDDFDTITAKLDADNPTARAEAAWSLAELASDDADRSWRLPVESTLAPLLTDDDRWVRRGASWAVANIADEYPQRARSALSEVTESLDDHDPLVRENGVLAVANVARQYPLAVEPVLGRLAEIVREDEGATRRYAAETLRRLVVRLDEDGFPETIEATPDIADLLGGELGVVEVTDDDGPAVRIRDGTDTSDTSDTEEADDEQASDDRADAGTDDRGPPDLIPEPPEIDGERADFERLEDVVGGPLTTAVKARVPSASDGGQHVVVVVRTLRSDTGVDPSAFETGVRAWAGIDDHDYVAPVLARGTNPRPWLAVEFLDGGTLRNALGSVGFERAVWYAHCIVTAVCHAHSRGVVHGALHPGAVGLSRVLGAWPVPKVSDWGLGDLLAEVRTPPVPPAFAAPEHLAPERFGRPDPATDVYQLGALCYALFAGRPPFVGENADIARKIRNPDRAPRPPSAHADDLPEEIDDVVTRALATTKQARFETAEDLRRELEVLARDLSLSVEL
ncbi:protein kinase domain-containing protein [Halorussus lipolyticus]|uniref:protein kinase domain-containing protein n=1 Tax=Halorussus lipolyticus TaxID=3034024 RepID=UPI0023E81BD3|nr:HEAT repeat domain-containing protein [Halorussus sp. DT80]